MSLVRNGCSILEMVHSMDQRYFTNLPYKANNVFEVVCCRLIFKSWMHWKDHISVLLFNLTFNCRSVLTSHLWRESDIRESLCAITVLGLWQWGRWWKETSCYNSQSHSGLCWTNDCYPYWKLWWKMVGIVFYHIIWCQWNVMNRPFWLSPRQAMVIPVAPKYDEYADQVCSK